MPDKRQRDGLTDVSLSSGANLIARRSRNRKGPFRLATRYGATSDSTIADADGSRVEALFIMEQIRHEHGGLYQELMAFASDWNRLRVLHALVEDPNGVTYDVLTEYANVTKRTLRKYLDRLEELDAVERSGKPVLVSFTNEEARLLAADVTAFA